MKKFISATVVMMALSFFFLSSCGKDSDKDNQTTPAPPVGVWQLGDTHICKFKSNGTYVRMWYDLGEYGEVTGTWSLDNSKTQMTMTEDYETTLWLVQSMDNNSMTLVHSNTAYVLTFSKANDRTGEIVGNWKCVKAELIDPNIGREYPDYDWTISFTKDGDYVYVGNHIYPFLEVVSFNGSNRLVLKGEYEIWPKRYMEYTFEKKQ
jgi:hypothetical protein